MMEALELGWGEYAELDSDGDQAPVTLRHQIWELRQKERSSAGAVGKQEETEVVGAPWNPGEQHQMLLRRWR